MRDISMLHPRIQDIIPKLKAVCLENGLVIGIGECVRIKEEQDNLYKKGRTLPGSPTACTGAAISDTSCPTAISRSSTAKTRRS